MLRDKTEGDKMAGGKTIGVKCYVTLDSTLISFSHKLNMIVCGFF